MRKFALITVFAALNLGFAAADARAGFDDDICRDVDDAIIACCPQCSWFCNCTM